jgi:pentatricopeptide repeat protein
MQALRTSKTTIACYGSVIRTWASLGQVEQAKRLLEEMVGMSERLPLDPIHFNAVFDACAWDLASEKDLSRAISRLSSIFDIIINMNRQGGYQTINVDPDARLFNDVIMACYSPWTTSRAQNNESSW